jgi:hypothetical protein
MTGTLILICRWGSAIINYDSRSNKQTPTRAATEVLGLEGNPQGFYPVDYSGNVRRTLAGCAPTPVCLLAGAFSELCSIYSHSLLVRPK